MTSTSKLIRLRSFYRHVGAMTNEQRKEVFIPAEKSPTNTDISYGYARRTLAYTDKQGLRTFLLRRILNTWKPS